MTSGDRPPERRLPVTPDALRSVWGRVTRRPAPGFPLAAPTWPGTVPRPPLEHTLGTDYDTEWARRHGVRAARTLVQELVARPAVMAVAAPTVLGLDRLAHLDEAPVIFAANHASHLDAPLLLSVIPERWRADMVVAGAADYFFDTRAKAAMFSFLINAVPVERQRVSRDSANHLASLVEEGWNLLIFPEGGRSPDGWGQPHRAGAAWLAVRTGRPVVPVHVRGTGHILPKGSARFRPGRTVVTFGRPLRPHPGAGPSETRALATHIEAAIARLADEGSTDWWTAAQRAAAGSTPALTGPVAAAWRRTWALGARPEGRLSRRAKSPSGWPPR